MPATSAAHPDDYLYSLMVKLRPRWDGEILPNAGQLAHAALLAWLGDVDPALAARLHEPNGDRPFTCSSLWFPSEEAVLAAQHANRRLPIRATQSYWLRVTLLADELFRTLTARFLQPAGAASGGPMRFELPSLRLGNIHFDIAELMATGAEDDGPRESGAVSWAGYATYGGLVAWARELDLAAPAARSVGLRFRSPTAFSDGQVAWGKRMHLFPDPDRVFGRLARIWNTWAAADLALDSVAVEGYARDWVAVAHHDLRTHSFQFDRHAQIGFTGTCTYSLMDLDLAPARRSALTASAAMSARAPTDPGVPAPAPPSRASATLPPDDVGADLSPARALHLLTRFAFFAGVGQKTTMGMGQTRPLTPIPSMPATVPAALAVAAP